MRPSWTFLGLSHQGADLNVRGQLFLEPHVDALYREILEVAEEALVLSTCNRSEIYAFGPADEVANVLRQSWLRACRIRPDILDRCAYRLDNQEVVRHLFLVAAGLEAQLVGETQIMGQLKEAFVKAAGAGAVGKELSMLVQAALASARKAHRETGLDHHPVSVGGAAVSLARRALGDLSGRMMLMVGAGEVAELCLTHLREIPGVQVVVANRTRERAEELARHFGGVAAGWEEIEGYLERADVVLSSTGAPHAVLFERDLRRVVRKRHGRPLQLVDLSVPRDIEEGCGALAGIHLSTLDDLDDYATAERRLRLREAEAAQAIAEGGAQDFYRRSCERNAVPLILSLRGRAETVRDEELERAFRRLGAVEPTKRRVIEQLASRIVNKLLNDPTHALKECALREDGDSCLRLAAQLFNLEGPDWPQEA